MQGNLTNKLLFILAGIIPLVIFGEFCIAQMTGPRTVNINPRHTTQPICDDDTNDGVDISTPVGTPVFAPASGTISAVWIDKTYGCGLSVMVNLSDGGVVGLTWLSDTIVTVGEAVNQGQLLAHSGKSGNAGSPKLHYTLFTSDGLKVNPLSAGQASNNYQGEKKQFTDPADLQKAIDLVNASDQPANIKEQERVLLLDRFNEARQVADARYGDNLKKAVDAWYTNSKNWRKIPTDVWEKLRPADQGRIKNGIDPEMRAADPVRHEVTPQK